MLKEYRFAIAKYDEEAHCLLCPECGRQIGEEELLARIEGRWVCDRCAVRWAESNGMPNVQMSEWMFECIGKLRCAGVEAVRGSELMGVIER